MQKLGLLRKNDKFTWNNNTYTVYDQADQMTEVFGNGKWWVWHSNIQVNKIPYGQHS